MNHSSKPNIPHSRCQIKNPAMTYHQVNSQMEDADAESDYLAPLFVGDKITITITVGKIGKTSFSFNYVIRNGKNTVGTAKTVHVTVDKKTKKKIPLPKEVRGSLEKFSRKK